RERESVSKKSCVDPPVDDGNRKRRARPGRIGNRQIIEGFTEMTRQTASRPARCGEELRGGEEKSAIGRLGLTGKLIGELVSALRRVAVALVQSALGGWKGRRGETPA